MESSTESRSFSDNTASERMYVAVDSDHEGIAALRATIDLAPVGIAQFDVDGRFLLVNSRLCAILGYPRDELLARTFQAITFPEDLDACAAANAQLAEGLIPSYQSEKRFVRGDGTAVWVRVTVSAVRRPDGAVAFFVGVAEDITEHRAKAEAHRHADELLRASEARLRTIVTASEDARQRAEHAARVRDDLLAVVAHDLRNPLHTIQLSASAIEQPGLTDDARMRHTRTIMRLTDSMDHLIGDLLDAARMEAGSFAVSTESVDLCALLDETVDLMQPQIHEHAVALVREDAPGIGQVMCDRHQMARVVSNLIANAIKYTPAGGRIVLRTQQHDGMALVSVEDNGRGISEDDLQHVFDRYWQVDRTSGAGAGLGLVIAKGIVESHGGAIWVESKSGQGTRFHFTIP